MRLSSRLLLAVLALVAAVAIFRQVAPGPGFREHARPRRPAADTLEGVARVVDGDTLDLGGRKIRLFGIDAPERAQSCSRASESYACGHEATEALRALADGSVTCRGRDTDRYGRLVAVCFRGRQDLNQEMVSQGWAIAYRDYGTDYVAAEDAARRDRRGMWAGRFDRPQDWRKQHRR